jgi:hypothetical protein
MKSVALPFGDGSVQVELPDRAQVVKASQPNARIAPAADEAEAVRAGGMDTCEMDCHPTEMTV